MLLPRQGEALLLTYLLEYYAKYHFSVTVMS